MHSTTQSGAPRGDGWHFDVGKLPISMRHWAGLGIGYDSLTKFRSSFVDGGGRFNIPCGPYSAFCERIEAFHLDNDFRVPSRIDERTFGAPPSISSAAPHIAVNDTHHKMKITALLALLAASSTHAAPILNPTVSGDDLALKLGELHSKDGVNAVQAAAMMMAPAHAYGMPPSVSTSYPSKKAVSVPLVTPLAASTTPPAPSVDPLPMATPSMTPVMAPCPDATATAVVQAPTVDAPTTTGAGAGNSSAGGIDTTNMGSTATGPTMDSGATPPMTTPVMAPAPDATVTA
ncbi:hypothetical protein BDK51DRAFT_37228, partial [Blyttiomyces helicus]